MKVCVIKASAPGPYKKYKQERGGPPQNIFSIAAATPSHVELEMVDETAGMNVNLNTKADLVAIFMSTPDAIRGYSLADQLKAKRKTVVFGGLHAGFMPDEALNSGDAVMVGEAEGIWEQLLDDYQTGNLKRIYKNEIPIDLSILNPYPTHLIKPSVYDGMWSTLVSRGCEFKCSFCLVNLFFKGQRYRPVPHVVEEIRQSGADWVELHADNLTADREYAKALFKALAPLEINWVGETTVRLAEDEELLNLAVKSGLRYLLLGLETPSKKALAGAGKGFVKADEVKRNIEIFHRHNIIIDTCAIFGFDEHDTNIFRETLDFMMDVEVDICEPVIMIPFPGSRIYKQLDQEGRILTRNWALYDGSRAVFQPKQMSPEKLDNGVSWFWKKLNLSNLWFKRKATQVKNIGLWNSLYYG